MRLKVEYSSITVSQIKFDAFKSRLVSDIAFDLKQDASRFRIDDVQGARVCVSLCLC